MVASSGGRCLVRKGRGHGRDPAGTTLDRHPTGLSSPAGWG